MGNNKNLVFLCDEGPMLEMLDYTIRIVSTPTFLYFNNKSSKDSEPTDHTECFLVVNMHLNQ